MCALRSETPACLRMNLRTLLLAAVLVVSAAPLTRITSYNVCYTKLLREVIFAADDQPLIDGFTQALIDFGFVRPGTGETGGDWRSPAGPDHVKNIRVWLDLIKANPQRSARLLSSLILHLKLGGVFIQDNDLFQRDVTSLLNADIRPLLFLVKQLSYNFV